MNINEAIQFGLLVKAAEAKAPDDLNNSAGTSLPVSYGAISVNYNIIATVYGNDLATDASPDGFKDIVSFGSILQAPNNDVVIALRGTEGIFEWMEDGKFDAVRCPFLSTAGKTEDGFTAVYESLRVGADPGSARVVDALASLPFQTPLGALTICGHSLGGALVTLLALDIAANTALAAFKNPTVYSYASPRTGDPTFADAYNKLVPNTYRIANRVDLVPKLPLDLPPLFPYRHVLEINELLPAGRVKFDILCEHHLTTYLFLLSTLTGGPVLPLDAECTA